MQSRPDAFNAIICYAMQLSVFTRELLQAIRWRSKYNGCTQKFEKQS